MKDKENKVAVSSYADKELWNKVRARVIESGSTMVKWLDKQLRKELGLPPKW